MLTAQGSSSSNSSGGQSGGSSLANIPEEGSQEPRPEEQNETSTGGVTGAGGVAPASQMAHSQTSSASIPVTGAPPGSARQPPSGAPGPAALQVQEMRRQFFGLQVPLLLLINVELVKCIMTVQMEYGKLHPGEMHPMEGRYQE